MHIRLRERLSRGWRHPPRVWLPAGVALAAALLVGGCSSYQLQGKVIEGSSSGVFLVPTDDPRLDEPGLAGARVTLTLDPDRLSAEEVGSGVSGSTGRFDVPVDEFGAGFLEHDVEVLVRHEGFTPAYRTIRLPGSSQRVLVVLGEGDDKMSPRRGDVLDETLRLGEPYMGR